MLLKAHIYLTATAIASVFSANLTKFHLTFNTSNRFSLLVNVLNQYQHYNLIIHIDNTTQDVVNNFLALHSTLTSIVNHDINEKTPTAKLGSSKCLNVIVFENPLKFSNYTQRNNINSNDVIMFLTKPTEFKMFAANYRLIPNLNKSGRIIVINYTRVKSVYTICYYCGDMSGRLTLLQKLKSGEVLNSSDQWFPNNFDNFVGHVMKVVYVDYFPYIYCINKSKVAKTTICNEAIGSEYQLLATLSRALNFSFQLIEATDQSYRPLIEGLVSGKFDFGIGGLSMTSKRRKKVQFSCVIRFEKLGVIFIYQKPLYQRLLYYESFNLNVNICLVAVGLSLTLLIYLMTKYSKSNAELSFLTLCTVRNLDHNGYFLFPHNCSCRGL